MLSVLGPVELRLLLTQTLHSASVTQPIESLWNTHLAVYFYKRAKYCKWFVPPKIYLYQFQLPALNYTVRGLTLGVGVG